MASRARRRPGQWPSLFGQARAGLLTADWTVGKISISRSSPAARTAMPTAGFTAARRRHPPSSLARRSVPTRTARPPASTWLTSAKSSTASGGAKQAEQLLAQRRCARDIERAAEDGNQVAALCSRDQSQTVIPAGDRVRHVATIGAASQLADGS